MKKLGKIHKLALVSLSSIVLVAGVVLAQNATTTQEGQKPHRHWGGHRKSGHFGRMGGRMFAKLNLTDDQKARMKTVRKGFGERTKSLREQLRAKHQELRQANQGGTFNEALATQKLTETASLRAKLMAEQFKLHQDMLAVLTPEQKTQLDTMRQQFKNKRGQ
jgi:Spy/CpxP family protein refolding chaperone